MSRGETVSVRPSLPRALPFPRLPMPAPQRQEVTWRSRCPHGAEGEWTAVRDDMTSRVFVDCPCVDTDAAIEPRFVGLPWTVA